MLHQLRQTRYLALGALMLVVASICIAAGTWQIARLAEKRAANTLLRHNAHAAAAPVADVLALTSNPSATHAADRGQFRTVTVTGSYQAGDGLLVRERTVNGTVGYLILTPLKDGQGDVVLVNRGFVAADGNLVPTVTAPPAGTVSITARAEPPENRDDKYGRQPGQISAINAASEAARLGAPVYDGFVELLAGQPGTQGLTVIPDPDLSNPAGGAVEPQHLAYIVQWYLFAALALSAPLIMARADSRRPEDLTEKESLDEFLAEPIPARNPETIAREAKLADRYGAVRRT